MKCASLFTGIGGFDLAAETMGWETLVQCEKNEFCQKILKYYWPNATLYGDITTTDFTLWRERIDLLTGGFPCQPYSVAGKRLGKDDERHLWPHMLRAVREIAPRWVVGENVRGLVNWNGGLVFEEVQADLEAEGYEVQPFILPACGVGAPHQRDRVWFIAKNTDQNGRGSKLWKEKSSIGELRDISARNNERISTNNEEIGNAANSEPSGLQGSFNNTKSPERIQSEPSECDKFTVTDPNQSGTESLQQTGKFRIHQSQFTANPDSGKRCEGRMHSPQYQEAERHVGSCNTRTSWSAWQNFPTQSPICVRNDGIPAKLDGITFSKWRNESIQAAGNAIVPQVAIQIFKAIQQYEITHEHNNH
jgi:DNA (cytosine-5)-methyltransferase 1